MTAVLLNQINRKKDMYVGWKFKSQSTIQEKQILKRLKEILTKIYKNCIILIY